jgi:hypothetical protein
MHSLRKKSLKYGEYLLFIFIWLYYTPGAIGYPKSNIKWERYIWGLVRILPFFFACIVGDVIRSYKIFPVFFL